MKSLLFFLLLTSAVLADVESLIRYYAVLYGVDPDLAVAVAVAESDLNPAAVSKRGAVGLMQLMPATARELGIDPEVPWQNAAGGVLYLKKMLERYRGDVVLALAAYNAGPSAVERYGGVPPYRETRCYIRRVINLWKKLKSGRRKHRETILAAISAAAVKYGLPPDVLEAVLKRSGYDPLAVMDSLSGRVEHFATVEKAVRAAKKLGLRARVGVALVSVRWLTVLGCRLEDLFTPGYNVMVAGWLLARMDVDLWRRDTDYVLEVYDRMNSAEVLALGDTGGP